MDDILLCIMHPDGNLPWNKHTMEARDEIANSHPCWQHFHWANSTKF